MKVQEVRDRVESLENFWLGDPSNYAEAGKRVDFLYRNLLRAIADGSCENPQEAAKVAIEVEDLNIPRYYD